MRTRLTWALALVATGGIVVAGVVTVFAVRRGVERSARSDIEHKATNIVDDMNSLRSQLLTTPSATPALRLRDAIDQIRSAVQVSDAHLVFVRADGGVAAYEQIVATAGGRRLLGNDPQAASLVALPNGVRASDLALDRVAQGSTTTLRRNGTVYLAERLPPIGRTRATPVIVVSEAIDTAAVRRARRPRSCSPGSSPIAACIAASTLLARRLTRRLTAIDTTGARARRGRPLGAGTRRSARRPGDRRCRHRPEPDGERSRRHAARRADVPAGGEPRPAHAAHVDPRLRRGSRRRHRRRDRRRRAPAPPTSSRPNLAASSGS